MRVFGHAMPTGKLGAEGGVIPISAKTGLSRISSKADRRAEALQHPTLSVRAIIAYGDRLSLRIRNESMIIAR